MLSVLVAAAVAAPHHTASHSVWPAASSPLVYTVADHSADVVIAAAEPEYAHVGSVVSNVPTAVSHQSRTDYHSTPVVKSVLAPVEYVQPIVHQHVEPAHVVYAAEPVVHHHHEIHQQPQLVYTSQPLVHAAAAPQLVAVHSAPQLVQAW